MKTTARARGFSMLEILVVLGMFTIVAGFGLLVSMETYRGSNFHSDRDLLVSLLQRARAQSINNLCSGSTCADGKPHGVHIDAANYAYVLFQGSTYIPGDPLNSSFDSDRSSSRDILPLGVSDVIFSQLTGTTSSVISITLTGGARTSTISISPEGQITWTN